jgi:hypothetical protein
MKTSLIRRILIFTCFISAIPAVIWAQGFNGIVSVGLNFAQIDGDQLSGYNHIGARLGLEIQKPLSSKTAGSIGLYYEQKGSSSRLNIGPKDLRQSLDLHYLSIIGQVKLYEWWSDTKSTYQLALIPGITIGRLFSINSTNPQLTNNIENFRSWDVGASLGLQYAITRRSAIVLRFERSILRLYQQNPQDDRSLQGFLLNLQYNYQL